MSIISAIVLFAVIWWMTLFIVLPLRNVTQGDTNEIEPGTHASAPADFSFKKKAKTTTFWAIGIYIVVAGIILSGAIEVRDFDWFNRMGPPSLRSE
ncbi:Predicted secreted protein [Loktanella sp. DSM 29012]|uniref:DUF1467 family protein n=1 Tax=Loktanella gaetbuli TaxID=2881335 RepID=A0ABS8BSU7_9RHOB|nr:MULTISPECIES: DUF1467 family protein [Loktanella]MCB5198697.1 DUF1467 family protein [Loktanella gaetbuli]SEQ62849.1 Predicted secreted protein [Loktanella sp. DSM 29012]